MSFYNPLVLFGLSALAIPIIIHLFNFRRTKKVFFSSTQFLEQIAEESTSKLKIKHWLILLARLLFIFFLVMAFAQPYIPSKEDDLKGQNVFIFLDNSFSMSNQVADEVSALDEGIRIIEGIVGVFPPETQYVFQTADFQSAGTSFRSRNELNDMLTEINYSGSFREMDEVVERFKNLNQRGLDGLWYYISDFQSSTTGELAVQIDSTQQLNLVPVSFQAQRNLFVDTVYIKNPFDKESDKMEIVVEIQNSGSEDVDEAGVRVFVDSVQTAGTVINVSGNSKSILEFDLGFTRNSVAKGMISIEEYPVTFDNDFYFTINQANKIRVFEIRGKNDQPFIEDVFGNASLFDFTYNDAGNVNYSLLTDAEFIILNGVETLPLSLVNSIQNSIDNGASLLLIPGINPDVSSYTSMLGTAVQKADTLMSIETNSPDFDNPFYGNVFEDEVSNIAMFSAIPLISWGQDRTSLLSFRNGVPFLSKVVVNRNVYVISSPLENDLNGFQNHALFVPIMYKLAFSSLKVDEPIYYSLRNNLIEIALDSVVNRNTIFRLVGSEVELVPDQRLNGNDLTIEIPPQVIETGFYYLSDEQGNNIKLLSFNSDKRESILGQPTQDDLRANFQSSSNINLYEFEDSDDFINEFRSSVDVLPLWKYALVLSLLFLLMETLIIRFYNK